MNNRKNLIIVIVIVVLLAIIFFPLLKSKVSYLLATIMQRGAVTKQEALATHCDESDTICVMKDGKLVSKKLSESEIKAEQAKYATEKEQHIQYAVNVAAAVNAIRAYTGISDLKLTRLNDSDPTYISYYCSPDNKCWAVNNNTHKVVQIAK